MTIPRVYRAEDIENVVEAIRMGYHAALLAPEHWQQEPFEMALDCVLRGFGLEPGLGVVNDGPELVEAVREQVEDFIRGGEAHELGDKRPTPADTEAPAIYKRSVAWDSEFLERSAAGDDREY